MKAKERRIYGNSNIIFSMQKYTKSSKNPQKKETQNLSRYYYYYYI
jgi:hypothetical protein